MLLEEKEITLASLIKAMSPLAEAQRVALASLLTQEPHLRAVSEFYTPLGLVDWTAADPSTTIPVPPPTAEAT